ncbi:hypothetical protein BC826DRAFT_1058941 [Russula brevipes]|nr:hypothetical protein BC826DRAFT_1058941 [Russula brevipes]
MSGSLSRVSKDLPLLLPDSIESSPPVIIHMTMFKGEPAPPVPRCGPKSAIKNWHT